MPRNAIPRVVSMVAAATLVPLVQAQPFSFQRASTVSLAAQFDGVAGYGTNPLSIAFDGTHAYVGGFNGSTLSGSVGIVKVENVLSASPVITPLPSTQFTAFAQRGLDNMTSDGTGIYAVYDEGGAAVGNFIRRYDSNGNQVWNVNAFEIVSGYRPTALAIDPLADSGSPALAMIGIGSGRRAALNLANGTVIFGPSGSPFPLGEIINPNPSFVVIGGSTVTIGATYRGIAFDSAGNVAVNAGGGASYGVRDTVGGTNFNRITTIGGGTASATTPVAIKQTAAGAAINTGQGIAFIEGLGDPLLAINSRVGSPFALSLTTTHPSQATIGSLDSRDVHILTTSGALPTNLSNPVLTGAEDGLTGAYTGEVKNFAAARDGSGNPILLVLSFDNRRIDVYTIEPTWKNDSSGVWSLAGNWVGPIPDSATTNATFGSAITAPRTVTLDSPRTVKQLKFNNPNAYTLSGSSTITLDAPGVAELPAIIRSVNGSHTVEVPVVLNDNARLIVDNAADVLTVSGQISGASRGVTKLGPGRADILNARFSALAVTEGTLKIIADGGNTGASRVGDLVIADDGAGSFLARLDLTDNDLVVATTPLSTVQDAVRSGYAGGSWNGTGIIASAAQGNSLVGLGVVSNVDLNIATFSGQAVSPTDTLVRYTLRGDGNLDGTVNIGDFSLLAANFNQPGDWYRGDNNYDGTVNIGDFSALAANFNQTMASDAASRGAVPEPTFAAGIAVAALFARRRR